MILEFSISNFRSFNSVQTLDFRATGLVSDNKSVDKSNIVEDDNSRTLKTIAIYGPNGSGKSNLIKGLNVFRQLVRSSLEVEGLMDFIAEPFRLNQHDNKDNAGFFQIILQLDKNKYRYGFTLSHNGTVNQEWLFGLAEHNETYYFKRTFQDITINKERFSEGLELPKEKLRDGTLFLTFVSAYDGPISQTIRKYISNKITVENVDTSRKSIIIGNTRRIIGGTGNQLTNRLLKDGKNSLVLEWLLSAGLKYSNIKLLETEGSPNEVILRKTIYDERGEINGFVDMNLRDDESAGTQKFYSYIGHLVNKFEEGGVFISDEIDNNFHPSLLNRLIHFFNNPEINKAGAQLIFTSHDTTLLQPEILRRDQIYFTEKSEFDETILYSLSDLKGIRNNADFARQYLAGFYGAIPILSNLTDKGNDYGEDSQLSIDFKS